MIVFDRSAILPGDILAVRSTTTFGKAIRAVLGSYTNHNALLVWQYNKWWVLEAVAPRSKLTSLEDYEALMDAGTVVRVLRVPGVSDKTRDDVNEYAINNMVGIPYPISVLRMVWYRFFNRLPFKIKGIWCSRIAWRSWEIKIHGVFNSPQGKVKKNETPRTFENRTFAGVLEHVSSEVLTTAQEAQT